MNDYKTTDLQFAALLYAMGRKVVSIDKDIVTNRNTFVFEDDGIEEVKIDLLNHKLQIDPADLFDAIKTVKGLIHGNL